MPTRSLLASPTRLLAAETTPEIPFVASAQVMAPAAVALPLFQLGLRMASLPLAKAWMPPLPIWSPAVEPTRLLAGETAPDRPVVGLNVVNAPAEPLHKGLPTSTLSLTPPAPRKRTIRPLPTWSLTVLPCRLDIKDPVLPL